ncbi:hypothetical protein DEU38_13916 [Rhodococcus sp. AG1013]|uniref:hypothetical protein n=1 Tax=Rhodococcus sp. AG1013 TaxID=2183996 RepID=UPI000E0A9AC8|nr:hypothetical protein [Rhodococcus sp. AG1013]RDI12047.1 hypothetical protein DEU38_13916 [Rhodococcus sp. AG1013]
MELQEVRTVELSAPHSDDIDCRAYAHIGDYGDTGTLVLGGCQWIEAEHGARVILTRAEARALGRALLDYAAREQ